MWPSAWEKPVVKGTYGAVSSNSCYATQAGLEILNKGGMLLMQQWQFLLYYLL
ncbi:hypothetical protein V3R02_06535 [Fusobacterium nucleatum]